MSKAEQGPKEAGAGESQGGAYPNPHRGTSPAGGPDSFLGHGGQSDMDYEGPDNPNATKQETKEPEDGE
jgi:hypothetical protein